MKYIFYSIFGVCHVLTRYALLLILTIPVFIWKFKVTDVIELWKDHKIFYISSIYSMEEYRYNTFMDFLLDRKDFTHQSKFFKK